MREARRGDDQAGVALIDGGCSADAAREQAGETAEAGEADFHTDVGDGVVAAGEEEPGAVETGLDAELMRGLPEEGFELADEVEGRDVDVARDVGDGERVVAGEEVACEDEAAEGVVGQEHGSEYQCNLLPSGSTIMYA